MKGSDTHIQVKKTAIKEIEEALKNRITIRQLGLETFLLSWKNRIIRENCNYFNGKALSYWILKQKTDEYIEQQNGFDIRMSYK